MKAPIRIALTVVAFGALLSGTLWAQGRGPQAGMRGGRGMGPCVLVDGDIDRFAALLELTDDQKDEVAGLVAEWQVQNAEVVERARKFHEERESVWSNAERPRRQAVMELAEKYDYPMRELAPKCQEFRESVGEILTAEQRAILERPGRRPRGPR